VEAATQAVQCGETPTIKDAAEAAGVSRATAYRYFTSQQALLLETSLDAIGTVPDPSLVDEGPVESRVDAAIRSLVRMAYEHEPVLRTFRMLSLEQWLRTHQKSNDNYPLRKGRRIAWLDRALAPLKCLSPRQRTAWVYEIKVGATGCERPKSLQIDRRECNSAGQGWHWLRVRTSAFQIA